MCFSQPAVKGLAGLPWKVLVRLLPLVSARDTLALERTCKRFQQLIAENPTLTQKFELSVSIFCGEREVHLSWDGSEGDREFRLAYDEPLYERHEEMNGRIAVIGDNRDYEIREPTPVVPTRLLLEHFLRKILAKISFEHIRFQCFDNDDIQYYKKILLEYEDTSLARVGLCYPLGYVTEATILDFISAFPTLNSLMYQRS